MSQDQSRLIRWTAACGALLLISSPHAEEAPNVWSRLDAHRVCPVASVWRLGVAGKSPAEMVETVVPMEVDGRAVWRVMHTMLRSPEDLRNGMTPGSDVFDLERSTLAPVQSEHRLRGSAEKPGNVIRFDYRTTSGVVQRLNADGSPAERIAIDPGGRVLADGPGAAVVDQAIAWSDGLTLRGHVVDRFRGRENQRLRPIEIAVTGRGAVEIGGRRLETFVVAERAIDNSYHAISQITVQRPHRRVHVQYYAGGLEEGASPFVSEVSALMQDASCRMNW